MWSTSGGLGQELVGRLFVTVGGTSVTSILGKLNSANDLSSPAPRP